MVGTNNLLQLAKTKALDAFDSVTYIGVGTGTTSPNASDTTLTSESTRVAIDSSNQDSTTYTFSIRVPLNTINNVTLGELGLFDASSGGNIYLKELFGDTFTVTSSDELIATITIEVASENY